MVSILLVEDDALQAEAIKLHLIECGYQIAAIVSQGEDAVERVPELHPDLVLMDIVLNGKMDGIEAAEKIHELCDIPVLYLTAYADDEFFRRARVTEPYAYLLKPCAPREIQLTIEIALYRHRSEKNTRKILEEKVAERTRELERTQLHMGNILESITDAFISLDADGCYTYANRQAGVLLDFSPDLILGKNFWKLFHEEADRPLYHACQQAQTNQTTTILKTEYLPRKRRYEFRIYPTGDGLSVFFQDINEQELSLKRLQQSERNLIQAQYIAHLGSWDFDMTTGSLNWSDELYRIYGVSPETFSPGINTFINLIHPEDQPSMLEWIAECSSGKKWTHCNFDASDPMASYVISEDKANDA